jgi:DNA polymerase-1
LAEKSWEDRAFDAIESMACAVRIAVDTETTGVLLIKDGRHYLTGVSTAWRDLSGELQTEYFPFRHKEGYNLPWGIFEKLIAVLSHRSKKLTFANLKFDAHSFATAGFWMPNWECKLRDIRIDQHYLNENFPKGLDVAARIYLKESKSENLKEAANAIGWEYIPSEVMAPYAKQDARLTYLLEEKIYTPKLLKTGLAKLIPEAMQYRMLLFEMEQEGVGANLEFCAEMEERGEKRMAEIRADLGFDPNKRTQLGKFLLDTLGLPVLKRSEKTLKPSFDKEVMAEYDQLLAVENNKDAQLILQYRGWSKAVTSLYRPVQQLVSPDGRIRANLNQTGTVTGRLSSSNPNLQQIPRDSPNEWNGEAKKSFNSGDPDYVLLGFDYSQLELRLGAWYGQDKMLIDEFNKPDGDPFKPLAISIFGEMTEDTRFKTKHGLVYPTNYGAGKEKVRKQLGVTHEKLEEIYDNYYAALPGLFKVSDLCQKRMKSRGYIKYWTGRRRRITDERKIHASFNSLLQGGGAELVKKAQLQSPHNNECKQVLQVHDEIVFKVRKDKVEKYTPIIIESMTNFPQINVPLKVEGKKWSSA